MDSNKGLFPSRKLGGVPFGVTECSIAADMVMEHSVNRDLREGGEAIHFVNAYTLSLAHRSSSYAGLLRSATLNLPDGKPLEWFSRSSQSPLKQVRGPSFFLESMDVGRKHHVRHFLLGGSHDTLLALQQELERRFPGVIIAGSYSPPFRSLNEEDLAFQDSLIRKAEPHVVWVGLGTPKQDFEAERLAKEHPAIAVAVGAAFDFVAGVKREAPRWVGNAGLEWLFRLVSEPRRLWKRYLVGNMHFLWLMMRDRVGK